MDFAGFPSNFSAASPGVNMSRPIQAPGQHWPFCPARVERLIPPTLKMSYQGVSENGWLSPKSSSHSTIFSLAPFSMVLGIPYFRKPPYSFIYPRTTAGNLIPILGLRGQLHVHFCGVFATWRGTKGSLTGRISEVCRFVSVSSVIRYHHIETDIYVNMHRSIMYRGSIHLYPGSQASYHWCVSKWGIHQIGTLTGDNYEKLTKNLCFFLLEGFSPPQK